jgi:signal transduction histidine kinase
MPSLSRALIVGALYLAAARYAIVLQDTAGLGAVFWPGAGVTLTGLLVSPRRSWPAILVVVGLVEFVNDVSLGSAVVSSWWWGVANMAEPLLAAWLIQRWNADRFPDVGAVVRFIGALAIAALLGGAIGAIGTVLGPFTTLPYGVIVGQWAIGDGLGMLAVVPFGLVVTGWLSAARLRSLEGVLALTVVTVTALVVFDFSDASGAVASGYLVLLPMVWAAVRLQVAGAAVALFVVAQVGNAFHALGSGPFAGTDLSLIAGSVQLQFFLATAGITVLLLACRTAESETFQDLADMRSQLIAAVSHELRTPLTPIVGFSELLLQREQLDPQSRQGLEVIHRNGRHLTSLVDDLLRASRVRRGSLAVTPEVITLAAIVDEQLAGRNGDVREVTIDPADVRVRADRTHLTQILTNLLDNAARHGQPPITVRATVDRGQTRIVVTDRGEGVPDWFVADLFDEFAQAAKGDQRPTLGLGLGLPIARALALANDGDLTYARVRGETRFTLRLPTAPAVSVAGNGAAPAMERQRHR